jgi:hypothetical protein
MEDPRIYLPAFAHDQPVGTSMLEDAVVTLVPLFQASTDIRLGRARFEAHVGVGKVVFHLVIRLRISMIGPLVSARCFEISV